MMAATDPNLKDSPGPDNVQSPGPSQPEDDSSAAADGVSLLAQVTTLAWNLVIPIVGGVLLGHYIDRRTDSGITWTMSLLVLGVMIAFSNLYNLYIEQGQRHLKQDSGENADEEIEKIDDKEE